MTALTEFLFPAPAPRSVGAITKWWESRRLAYNMVVGATGLVSVGLIRLISAIPPNGPDILVPGRAILAVGLLANLCYFLGPTVEVAIEKLSGGRILPTGPTLFRMGLTFSAGLVLLPTLMFSGDLLFRILRWIL